MDTLIRTDYAESSDTELLCFYRKGDQRAGDVLFERYRLRLHKFFQKRIRKNSVEAEDLVQRTFLEVLKSLKKEQTPRNFQAWLYTIAKRVLAKWITEKQRARLVLLDDTAPENEAARSLFAPVTDQPEHCILDNELGTIRGRFEKTLRKKTLAIFKLRCNSDLTFKEIGHALGMKPEAVKVQHHRAVKAFRQWLEKHYPDIYRTLSERQ